jgi:hypothetical protein
VLLDERQPFVPVGQALMFYEFPEEDIPANRTQPEGDRIEDQPKNDVLCRYMDRLLMRDWMSLASIQKSERRLQSAHF